MSDVKGCVYVNGEYFSLDKAKLSVFDKTFFGINVYDAAILNNGYVFKIDTHLGRFYQSLKAARIEPRLPREELKEVIFETARRSGLAESHLVTKAATSPDFFLKQNNLVLILGTAGTPPPGQFENMGKPTQIVEVFADKPRPYRLTPEQIFRQGVRVHIANVRNLPQECIDMRIKHFNRLHMYLAIQETIDVGADDVILLDGNGNVSEGTWANVWIVKDGNLFTPGGEVLHGITRATVSEIAQKEGITASELTLSPYDLYNADEVFFSSTRGGIVPIIEVAKRTVADGKPGPITQHLRSVWYQMLIDPQYATSVAK